LATESLGLPSLPRKAPLAFLLFLALTGIFIKLPIVAITSLIISFFIYISPVIAGKVVESTKKKLEKRRKFLEKKGELLEQMENGKTLKKEGMPWKNFTKMKKRTRTRKSPKYYS
jgi:membrane protein implicated in regulation of membrane protease activity